MRDPAGPVFSAMSHFIDLTAVSAQRFKCGLYAELTLWLTPHVFRKAWVSEEV